MKIEKSDNLVGLDIAHGFDPDRGSLHDEYHFGVG